MFVSTYDRLIQEGIVKGEAIGIQKGEAIGERKRSLELVIDLLVSMPNVQDGDIVRLSKMPERFVKKFRDCISKGKLSEAQKAALENFNDLPGFNGDDAKKIKSLVKKAFQKLNSPKQS
jgi:hypothetical protein